MGYEDLDDGKQAHVDEGGDNVCDIWNAPLSPDGVTAIEPTRIKLEKKMTEREILALLEVCHKIMQGLKIEQIADIIKSIQRKGEE